MTITSEWQRSDALVGRDGFCRTEYAPAPFLRECYSQYEDFTPSLLGSTTTYAGYTVTQITLVGSGILVMADAVGGVLQVRGGPAVNEGIQMQSDGELFLPAAGLDMWYECRLALDDADDAEWMAGLASTDANVLNVDPTELICYRGNDGDLNLDFQVRNGGAGATADTGTDMADGTYIDLGFWVVSNTSVIPYINGVAQTAVTANIPTAEMSLTFAILNGATTADQNLNIDWYRILQLRT